MDASISPRLPLWLECPDRLAPADVLLVLDGGDSPYRLDAALDLFNRGFGSHLLVSQTIPDPTGILMGDSVVKAQAKKVFWMYSTALSTREEALQTREALKRLGCSSVLVVTSCYHARRARWIFTRELRGDGIEVRVFPAPVPFSDGKPWWRSRAGRSTVLFETAKFLLALLRLDPPLRRGSRVRLKEWVERTIP